LPKDCYFFNFLSNNMISFCCFFIYFLYSFIYNSNPFSLSLLSYLNYFIYFLFFYFSLSLFFLYFFLSFLSCSISLDTYSFYFIIYSRNLSFYSFVFAISLFYETLGIADTKKLFISRFCKLYWELSFSDISDA
jgi:hypothetical protein